jgi:hypothetical protein
VSARELIVGDELYDSKGNVLTVEDSRLEVLEEAVKVYNFQVEDFHTYHVGANGVLVHNTCPKKGADGVYEPSPKHDPDFGWGSENPIPNKQIGQELLDSAFSSSKNKQLYNFFEGKLIKFQPDGAGGWHSYVVSNPAKEVPADVLRQMLKDGLISKAEYGKLIKNK